MFLNISSIKWKETKVVLNRLLDGVGKIPDKSIQNDIRTVCNDLLAATETLTKDVDSNNNNNDPVDEKVNNLTNSQFNQIMNEIEQDTSSNNKSITITTISKQKHKQQQQQASLKKLFLESSYKGIEYYTCESIKDETLLDSDKNYKILFEQFNSIHNNLINTKLKDTLVEFTNKYNNNSNNNSNNDDNVSDIDRLYENLIIQRKVCALLPFKQCERWHHTFKFNKKDTYRTIINYLNNSNSDILKLYLMIYNGVSNMCIKAIYSSDGTADKYGFDYYLFMNSGYNDNSIDLVEALSNYILNQISQTTLFGHFYSYYDSRQHNQTQDTRKNELLKQKEAIEQLKKDLFDNDMNEFNQLIKYCLQDLIINQDKNDNNDNNNNNSILNVYDNNINKKDKRKNFCYGIVFFIINRLSFVIFHDLIYYKYHYFNNIDTNNISNDSESKVLLFPKLKKFYKFFYNFSVYAHCYPSHWNEYLFCIEEFYNLKDTIYELNLHNKDKNGHLREFNYFLVHARTESVGGTLLHSSVSFGSIFSQYSKLLLTYGFSRICNVPNCYYRGEYMITPFTIAQGGNDYSTLSLMKKLEPALFDNLV